MPHYFIIMIVADGFKLSHLLVFKAKENVSNLIYVKDGSIFVYCNDNAWVTKKLFLIGMIKYGKNI